MDQQAAQPIVLPVAPAGKPRAANGSRPPRPVDADRDERGFSGF